MENDSNNIRTYIGLFEKFVPIFIKWYSNVSQYAKVIENI